MLERYFIRPDTIDRYRSSWIGGPIERYVEWLTSEGYAARNVFSRVPILWHFGEFARARGATAWEELPDHLDAFVEHWVRQRAVNRKTEGARRKAAFEARNPAEQLLRLVLPDFAGRAKARWASEPFRGRSSGFFAHLCEERGLRDRTIAHYRHYLAHFQRYLTRVALQELADLSPPVLGAFIAESSRSLCPNSLRGLCGVLRVFLRYLYREQLIPRDLSASIEFPRQYRHATIPRAIAWDEVRRMLAAVERRTAAGKRDFAILLLLVTYGLRGHEVAALTLDDFDWKRDRLRVPERKAGHSTAYPLSPTVGAAVLDYLQHGRPETTDRHVFFRVLAPIAPLRASAVSSRAAYYLHRAGIHVSRAGAHTLRHTCVQRLVDAEFPFKVIGDYVGHRSPDSTGIYAKVATEVLRELALGDGEEIL
jgi:site-specific recombinase XerD